MVQRAVSETPIRIVAAGTARDAYLPLLRLADDSESEVRGYYQAGDLSVVDDDAGRPLGLISRFPCRTAPSS